MYNFPNSKWGNEPINDKYYVDVELFRKFFDYETGFQKNGGFEINVYYYDENRNPILEKQVFYGFPINEITFDDFVHNDECERIVINFILSEFSYLGIIYEYTFKYLFSKLKSRLINFLDDEN